MRAWGEHRHIAILKVDDIARVLQHGGRVGRHNVFSFPEPQKKRRKITCGNKFFWVSAVKRYNAIRSFEPHERYAHGFFKGKTIVFVSYLLYKMCYDLGVGLGSERMPRFFELVF